MMIDGAFRIFPLVFNLPDVPPFVVEQFGIIVSLVQVLENRRENFWMFVGQIDSSCVALEELLSACGFEEWGSSYDIFVAGKDSLLVTNADGDNGRG